tara:strand:- start:8029 stop:8265 length:237 start_codon:yes stop_codon:yes gene_type:complete
MDIKVITGLIGSAIAIGSLFVFQGQLIQRVDTLESKSGIDIRPIEVQMNENKSDIAVLKQQIKELKETMDSRSNPLSR